MELRSFILQSTLTPLFPSFTCCIKPSFQSKKMDQKVYKLEISRRMGLLAAMTSIVLAGEGIFSTKIASGFDFGFVAPDQTIEEAESGVRSHAKALLQVKDLLETESWKEAQKALRRSSALLKKDIYTIINSKPGSERPPLRKLYSSLFNNVSRLDYAARDKDTQQVRQCYNNIVVAVNGILSRIYPS
ncbi:psbQ-like protein 3, chloroplastic isoform X1 [Prosopis cineraria]|uniref:psbQ-like protein 3, chloroplastic isoform X1 n=1 Tax=Prosopis cineraria TaxID=364024 RepID=UPI00240F1C35|nr:psbQ-like protein 3, chloroplastic isoform X1 [Prosopis cineraria]XP_054796511.1 psbQ-like protein 3, chloroplastic isoform X1 [Prosopis cineraria]